MFGWMMAAADNAVAEKLAPEVEALKAQFDGRVKYDVQQPYDTGLVDLNTKYVAALDRAMESAQRGGKLNDVLAMQAEKATVSGTSVPATDDSSTNPALKQLRDNYRNAFIRLDEDRKRRLKPLAETFAKSLDALIVSFTRSGRLVEATSAKELRDGLDAAATGKNGRRVTAAMLVERPWTFEIPTDGYSNVYTFKGDKTVSASQFNGKWAINGDVLRIENDRLWVEFSAELTSKGKTRILQEIISSKGKREGAGLVQAVK
jgi:hypothetical protein